MSRREPQDWVDVTDWQDVGGPDFSDVKSGASTSQSTLTPNETDIYTTSSAVPSVESFKGLLGIPRDGLSSIPVPSPRDAFLALIQKAADPLRDVKEGVSQGKAFVSRLLNAPSDIASGDPYRLGQGTAALMTATPIAAEVAPQVTSFAGQLIKRGVANAPLVNRWMGVSAKTVGHGSNPGQQIIDSGLLANTKEATLRNVERGLSDLGPKLDAKFTAAAGKTIDASDDVLNALNSGARDLSAGSDAAFQGRLGNILDTITREFPDLDRLTPARARVLKTRIYDSMYFSGAAEESPINTVLSKMSSGINEQIKTKVPGIAEDFRQWGNLYQAKKALKAGIDADTVGQGTGTMARQAAKRVAKGAAIAGAGAGAAGAAAKLVD